MQVRYDERSSGSLHTLRDISSSEPSLLYIALSYHSFSYTFNIEQLIMDHKLFEGAELTSELDKKYLAVSSLGQSNVWTAVENDNFANIVVLKAPSDTDLDGSWPAFRQEMIMHELFKESKHIRRQVDRISPMNGGPPMLVLEIADMTLW